MYKVIIESPYGSANPAIVTRNRIYAEKCLLDSLLKGEAPLASHLLYTRVLDDLNPNGRRTGIAAGHAWIEVCDAVVVYEDLGLTPGMELGIKAAQAASKPVIFRSLSRERGIPVAKPAEHT